MASKQNPGSNLEVSPFDQKCISIHGLMVVFGSLTKAEATSSSIGSYHPSICRTALCVVITRSENEGFVSLLLITNLFASVSRING